ncbi:hypothetical protein [Shouchella patagoniensis]|uniref:hypothetical protein n=1 Tax=Shouchella patagoniensis TaxID=228576 RepID=UPI0009949008|nr:hypothetical protein [Shouchella patagoniensis]
MKKKNKVRPTYINSVANKVTRITNLVFEKQANDVMGLAEHLNSLSDQEFKDVIEEFDTLIPNT